MSTVAEGISVGDHRIHRQAQLKGKRATGNEHGAATFCLKEPAATTVIRTGNEPVIDAFSTHGLCVCGGIHIAEALEGFHLHIVDTTGDHKVRFAEGDFVNRFFY